MYQQLLGLQKPWTVDRVELDVAKQRVDVFAKHDKPKSWPCPECGKSCGLHDHAPSAPGGTWIAAASKHTCMHASRA